MITIRYQLSSGLCALCLFVLVNVLLSVTGGSVLNRFKPVKDQGVLFQACDSAVAAYRAAVLGSGCSAAMLNTGVGSALARGTGSNLLQLRGTDVLSPVDVVLLGSSVLVAPLWSVDAAQVAGVPDLYHHHRCYVLEKDLSKRLSRANDYNVVSMAIPGAMVSDLFLLTDKVLQNKPALLVVALCPRDFMDDLLTGETKTAVFQSLVGPQDLLGLSDLYFSSAVEKVDFVLNSTIFLYGKRWRYQQKLASYVAQAVNCALPVELSPASNTISSAVSRQVKADRFLQESDREQVWKKSIEEYRVRYRHFNEQQFAKQVKFLDCLLAIAAQRKMKVVLVNMPLTQENLALMPPGLYDNYLDRVTKLADRYNAGFVDCQHDPYYAAQENFYDTVHLNKFGGAHFVQTLADTIAASKRFM